MASQLRDLQVRVTDLPGRNGVLLLVVILLIPIDLRLS